MKIAVRIDDITPDMDWDSFYRFKELLDEYGIKPLIGVVPDNQDTNLMRSKKREDFWIYIKELRDAGWSIALHGYQHIYTTKKGGIFPLNNFSEFAGVSYEKQKEMIAYGQKKLAEHDVATDVFMAPGHSYDKNTLKALQELGFRYVTDGFGREPYFYEKYQLTFLPISFHSGHDLKRNAENQFTTLVYHLNGTNDRQLKQYRKLFEKYRSNFISYEEYKKRTAIKSNVISRSKEKLLAHSKFIMVRLRGILKK